MMKKVIDILLLLMVAIAGLSSAVSCEYEFELRDMPQKPLLCVECIPGLSDTTFVRVRVAAPVGNYDVAVPPVSDASVRVSVNGEDIPVVLYENGNNAVTYYSLHKVSCGDMLEMTAHLDGLDPVSSATVIPAEAPECGVEMEKRDRKIVITASVTDNPQTDDFYAISFVRKIIRTDSDAEILELSDRALSLTGREEYPDLVNAGIMQMEPFISFYVFDDRECFSDGIKTVSVCGDYSEDYRQDYPGAVMGYVGRSTRYMINCSRLSPECYYYLRSRYEVRNNDLAYLGWAPGNFAYTNVTGGLGVFGGAATSSSGWLENI